MHETIATIERAAKAQPHDQESQNIIRSALRQHLIGHLSLSPATSLAEALGALKDESRPHAETAALIIRCLAIQGALPSAATSNQIARAVPSFCEKSLPEICRYFHVEEKKQNFEKLSTLMGVHQQILLLLAPLASTPSFLERQSTYKQSFKQALNNNCVRQYLSAFGHAHMITTLDALFSQVASINEDNDNLTSDLQVVLDTIEEGFRYCESHESFLTDGYFRPILESAKSALEAFKAQVRSRFAAKLVADLGADMIIEKRQPLHAVGRTIKLTIPIRNAGPAKALSTSASIVVEGSLALNASHLALGSISPGQSTLTFDALVVDEADSVDGLAQLTWSELGRAEETSISFPFKIVAQSRLVDWEALEFDHPYSPAVAKGSEFIGRNDKVRDLAKKMLRTPMESFYVTGQKRVGKTSLVLASADFAKRHHRGGAISDLYLLWGTIAHDDPRASIEELGRRIAALILGVLPSAITVPVMDFRGSLAPLTTLAELALSACPERKFVIIVDEFDEIHSELYVSGSLAETLFGNIRALTNYSNICMVLVGGENMPFIMDSQGQKLNKLASESLDYYSRNDEWDDFKDLIRRPTQGSLAWHDDAIDYVFRQTNGNPYFAKILCASVFAQAIKERDAHITFEEVQAAFNRKALVSDSPSFQHLWQDGIHKPILEREPDVLRRTRVLMCVARTLRRDQEVTVHNVFGNRGTSAVTEAEIGAVLHEFTRRNVMKDDAGVFSLRLPLFQEWLKEIGIARLAHDAVTEELAKGVQAEEDLAYVRPTEVSELTSRWPTYQGRQIGSDDLRAWLEQVDTYRQQRLLFKIASKLTFYSESRIRELLRIASDIIKTLLPMPIIRHRGNRRDDLVLLYVDGEGKSGSFYASRFADENSIYPRSITSTQGFTKLMAARLEQKIATNGVVVIDDIVASGMSLSVNLKAFIDENGSALRQLDVPFIVFVITSTASGDEVVRSTLDCYGWLKWDLRVGSYLDDSAYAFGATSDIWADESESERAKALVTDLGSRIYRDNPLGFDGQALLVVFPDTCPNNTLPIIHSPSKKGQKTWKPLFRRLT